MIKKLGIFIVIASITCTTMVSPFAMAATVDELQQQIDSHNQTLKQLQDEISKYQTELSKTSAQAKTLQSAVQTLDLNAKKLGTDLQVTQTKINTTDLTIQQLSDQILDKQRKINADQEALASTLRDIHEADANSLMESVLVYKNLSDFWNQVDTINQFQSKVADNVTELKSLQEQLLGSKQLTEAKKNELVGLKDQLADQKTVVEVNKNQKAQLLSQTKETEKGYQSLIADRKAKEKAFEDELNAIQAQLKLQIDPKSVPGAKAGILAWPLTRHTITQYFGNTEFAAQHAAVYSGQGHNGIDLAAAIGTKIMSAADGVVLGTGNTDTACPGASFGKWVMVQHTNGLSTLYAHLSVIKAVQGQQVSTGDVLGYSGMTGYATGPHLHFTVYASQGVKIMSRASKACDGGVYTMPIADLQAYLNPLSYLSAP